MSRLLQIIGLLCRIQSRLQSSSAKETYNFKEPTNRSHPICQRVRICLCLCLRVRIGLFHTSLLAHARLFLTEACRHASDGGVGLISYVLVSFHGNRSLFHVYWSFLTCRHASVRCVTNRGLLRRSHFICIGLFSWKQVFFSCILVSFDVSTCLNPGCHERGSPAQVSFHKYWSLFMEIGLFSMYTGLF